MDGISALLIRMRALALGAANEAVNDQAQLVAYQADFDEAVKSITRIAEQSRFGTIPLLQGNLGSITLADDTKAFYSGIAWDATKLPGGLQPGSTVTVQPPVQDRTQVSAKFYGNPPATTAIQGLNQNGTQLDNVSGNVTVTGPLGAATYALTATTTIGEFVAKVNQDTLSTGAMARYDATTGELTVASRGPGALNLRSDDFTINAATSVGLLDSDTAAGANPLVAATGNLQRERFEVVLTTTGAATAPFPARTAALDGVFQNGVALAVLGGEMTTITGLKGSTTVTVSAGMTINDFVERVNLQTPVTGVVAAYDPSTGGLVLENQGFGSGILDVNSSVMSATTVGLFDLNTAGVNPLHTPRETLRAAFTTGGAVPVAAVAGDPLLGLIQTGAAGPFTSIEGQQFTINGRGLSATMDFEAPASAAVAAAYIAQTMAAAPATWTAGVATGTGTLDIGGNLFNVGASTNWYQLADFANSLAVTTLTGTTVGVSAGTMTLTGTYPGSLVLEGTSIQDVVNFVNSHTADLGTQAVFAAGTLTITGQNGPVTVSSDDLTGGDVGLFDFKASDPDAISNGVTDPRTAASWNSTLTLDYTDALGTQRSLQMRQIPTLGGGLAFTNLGSGPESTEPYTRWESGAFTVTVKDSSAGTFGGVATTTDTARTSQRQSMTWIQTGGFAGQRVNIEIPDMRAGALGRTALWAELNDPNSDQTLSLKGYDSLDDLVTRQAILNGDAQLVLSVVDAAINEVTNARGKVGSLQANSLEATLDSLRVALANLGDSQSRIRDTDFALESASFARNNILYQASTSMLAQANQVPQTVLQLLK
jgi:flagellin-like hook-associated protein FlgL